MSKMIVLVVLCTVFCLKIAQGDDAGLGITPPQFKSTEIQDLAQRILDDTDSLRRQTLELVNYTDNETRRLNAILVSYKSLLTDIQGSNPPCSVDDVSVTNSTFQRCITAKQTIDLIIAKAKDMAQTVLGLLQTVDSDLEKITDATLKKLKIAEANCLVCSDFYRFITNADHGILDERYNIQSCIDETSAQLWGQVQVNLRTVKDCLAQKN